MISLTEYLKLNQKSVNIDGHIHPFDHTGCLDKAPFTDFAVGFPDIVLKYPEKYNDMTPLYKEYMPLCKWVKYWLLTGLDIDIIKKTWYDFPVGTFSGFGELKLYDGDRKVTKNHKHIEFAAQVCQFSSTVGNLPVYIHFELDDKKDFEELKQLAKNYWNIPIVLCHLGMNTKNNDFAWQCVLQLSKECPNIYFDISWSGARWAMKNLYRITELPLDRCFWGSDLNVTLKNMLDKGKDLSMNYNTLNKIYKSVNSVINSDMTIKKLFSN